ncbi:MAG: hypothetical protein R2786_02625 [Flavobacteriaceae bacterium]
MKKVLFVVSLLLVVSLQSCKNSESESEATENQETSPKLMESSSYTTYSGEYFYSDEAIVLKGSHFIYAVTRDALAKELGDRIAPIKKDDYDLVPVMVKGVVEKNPAYERGEKVWEEIITIKEIISVSSAPADVDVTIEEKKS